MLVRVRKALCVGRGDDPAGREKRTVRGRRCLLRRDGRRICRAVSQSPRWLPVPSGRALRLHHARSRMRRRRRRSVRISAIAGNLSRTFFPIPNRKTGWFAPSGFLCAFFVSHAQHFRMRFLFLASCYASQNSFLVTLTHLPAFLSFFFMFFEFCRNIFFIIHGIPLANHRRILYSKTREKKSVRPAHT